MLRSRAVDIGLNLDSSQLDAFEAFEAALYKQNEVRNLTRVPREECWIRHFLDSLLIQALIPSGSGVLDIGTGPGFPAWPLAAARPDLRITAIDSSAKMTAFLSDHLRENLSVVAIRAEDRTFRNDFDVVTGRALAKLSVQLELSAPACKIGGTVIPMRTAQEAEFLPVIAPDELGLELESTVTKELPHSTAVRLFPVYRKVRRTPNEYPRRWVEIHKTPLD